MAPPSAQMALVAVPTDRLVLVDAPALSHVPRLLLVGAVGVRAVAAVNRRLGSVIAQAQAGTRGPALLTHGLSPVLLGGTAPGAEPPAHGLAHETRASGLLTHGLGYKAAATAGQTYTTAPSADSSPRLANVLAHATRASGLLIGGSGYAAESAGRTRGHASAIMPMALGAGTGNGGVDIDVVDYTGWEARNQASQVTEILRIRARLEVMIDKVPMDYRRDLRAVISKLHDLDPVAPVHHWVVPRLENQLLKLLGEEIYGWTLDWKVQLHNLNIAQVPLINAASSITTSIRLLSAQILHSIMHTDASKAALPFDSAIYDVTPLFLKTISNIEGKLHENIDLLSFTSKPPVTMQQMVANHARTLLLTWEAVVDYRGVVNPALDANSRSLVLRSCECDPVTLMKELKKNYNMLKAEESPYLEYLIGSCEKQTLAVEQALMKLKEDVRPLRLRD